MVFMEDRVHLIQPVELRDPKFGRDPVNGFLKLLKSRRCLLLPEKFRVNGRMDQKDLDAGVLEKSYGFLEAGDLLQNQRILLRHWRMRSQSGPGVCQIAALRPSNLPRWAGT